VGLSESSCQQPPPIIIDGVMIKKITPLRCLCRRNDARQILRRQLRALS
jgi:hypothetical protein